MKTIAFCSLAVLLFTAESCKKTEVADSITLDLSDSCGADKKVVKTVTDVEGSIGFDSTLQQYFIRHVIPGTYDSQDIGLLCGNVPANLQIINAKVVFSGVYKEFDKPSPATIGGKTYYYLDLSKAETQTGK